MPTPVIPLAADPENETLASALNNFILNFYGAISKTVVNGEVVWVLPCDLSTGIPGYPRDPSLGTACYFKSLFETFGTQITNAEAVALAAAVEAANALAAAQAAQLTADGAQVAAGVAQSAADAAQVSADGAQVSADAAQVSADDAQTDATAALVQLATLGTMSLQDANTVAITGGTITGLPLPSGSTDAVSKQYADSLSGGIVPKTSCGLASTANLTLSGEQTIDGVLTSASRILVKNQTLTENNGIYVTGAGAWTRATDADTAGELLVNQYYFVAAGTVNAGSGWFIFTAPTVLGTDPVVFSQFSASSSYTAGTGLTLAGVQFSLTSPVTVALGGTGLAGGYTVGDLVYATGVSTLARFPAVAAGQVIVSNGVSTVPFYSSSPSLTNITLSGSGFFGNLVAKSNQLNEYTTNGTASVALNYDGYNGGITQFRDVTIYDGKNAQVAKFTGSTKALDVAGTATLTGNVGIGVAPATETKLNIGGSATGATSAYGVLAQITVASDVTTLYSGYLSQVLTQAAAFTLGEARHFSAQQSTIGAGSAITIQTGFHAAASLTGATTNYGFRGAIASGTNRYNLYMDGTAQNYLAGETMIGSSTDMGGFILQVTGNTRLAGTLDVTGTSAFTSSLILADGTLGTATGALYFSNDTNTGLYRSGADAITIFTGGAAVGLFNTAGLAVTGTLSATSALSIDSASTGSSSSLFGPTAPSINGSGRIRFINSNSVVNWLIGHNVNVASTFEITPSTVAGGSTFTTPVLQVSSTGLAVTGEVFSTASFYNSTTGNGYRWGTVSDGSTGQLAWVGSTDVYLDFLGTLNVRRLTGGTNTIFTASSTGLAVTGTLSASVAITATGNLINFGAGSTLTPYMQHAAATLDIKGGSTGGVRILNNSGSVANATFPDAGGLAVTGTLSATGSISSSAGSMSIVNAGGYFFGGVGSDTYIDGSAATNVMTHVIGGSVVGSWAPTGLAVAGRISNTDSISMADGQPFNWGGHGSDTYIVGSAATNLIRYTLGGTNVVDFTPTGLSVTGDTTTSSGYYSNIASGAAYRATSATTGALYIQFTNTGGSAIFGQENSAGNNLIVGASAYDTIIRGPSGLAFSANAGSAMQMRLSASGLSVTGRLSTTAGITRRTNVVTTTYTVDTTTTDDIVIGNHASTAFTITMVAASGTTGRVIIFKNKGAANVTIDATGLGQIDGSNTLVLSQYDCLTLVSDGTTWNDIS